jgi:predicted amidohydrolase
MKCLRKTKKKSMGEQRVLELLISAIHFRPEKADLHRNKTVLLSLVESALKQGADLVVAPELALSGFAFDSAAQAKPHAEVIPGPFTADVQGLTQNHGGTVVVGMAERDASSSNLYNSAVVIESTGVIGRYRQSHWPQAGSPGPYGWANSSPSIIAAKVNAKVGSIDVVVCADILRLDSPLLGQPPNLLAIPANWNDDPSYPCLMEWRSVVKKRRVPLIIANRHGDEAYSDGRSAPFSAAISCIIDDSGTIRNYSRLQLDHIITARL